MIKLWLPLRDISINQPFGANYLDFYQKLGMKGHNGVDFKAYTPVDCFSAHSGKVVYCQTDGTGGISVQILDEVNHFRTIYYHLQDFCVTLGQYVKAGQKIGRCDNTGLYTTGSHLHFGLKLYDNQNFNVINYNNGYFGAIDPMPYFVANYQGVAINPKDAGKSNAYHRYFRPERNIKEEVRIALVLKTISFEKVNACVYGGWDREAVQNPSMYEIWGALKKNDYLNGLRPYAS